MIAQFHIFGLLIVVVMSGSVAFESLVLGEISSAKIGYMQIQSGLANAAIAITALLVLVLGCGRYAQVAIVLIMLIFFCAVRGKPCSDGVDKAQFEPR